MSLSRRLARCAAGVVLATVLASCSSQLPAPAPSRSASVAPTPSPSPSGDGILTIGTLFPTTGDVAFIAPAQSAGVELAVREINKLGGVLGKSVVVVPGDSGDAKTKKLEESFAALVDKDVDVVIGPSSSVLVERILPAAVAESIAVITPAAISPRLSTLDDGGLLSRTISSASLQGSLLAEVISASGTANIGLIYFDDSTGNGVHHSMKQAVSKFKSKLVTAEVFDASTKDVAPMVKRVVDAKPDAVVIASPFSAMTQNKALITQLTLAGAGHEKLWLTSGNLADYSQALPLKTLSGVRGIIEGAEPDAAFTTRIKSVNKSVTSFRYAAEAYDATLLAALAAIVGLDDAGESVAAKLRIVSAGGIKCLSFADCVDVLKTQRDIDFDGVSGPVNLDEFGDPSPAHFGVYQYKTDNKFYRVDGVVAG